ncbi:MAG: hypothetical protein AMXMBFR34_20330 [Myxococcaceae bacterium]
MRGNRLMGLLLALGVGAAVFFLWPKPKRTPEEEVRELVARAVDAAQKRDAAGVTESLADTFHGPSGTSAQEVKRLIVGHLFRNQSPLVVLNPVLDVTVTSPTAASFKGTFIFARGQVADWQQPGDGASRYDISAELEKQGGDWKIITAAWAQ